MLIACGAAAPSSESPLVAAPRTESPVAEDGRKSNCVSIMLHVISHVTYNSKHRHHFR